jgi:putative nucleotidyltransferase with HDIG domain
MSVARTAKEKYGVAKALEVANSLPPLSPLVRHLLSTISGSGESASMALWAGWIENDMLAAGKVLALANSAFYSRGAPVLSLRLAVARLGLNATRDLLLGMSMKALWRGIPIPPPWSVARFVEHSIATALLSEMMASMLAPAEQEFAFLAGLFHDIGRLILAVLLRDESNAIERLSTVERSLLLETELELAGVTHPGISAAIVESWNLPPAIETAIRFHENPAEDPGSGGSVRLSEIVHASDTYVDERGYTLLPAAIPIQAPAPQIDPPGLRIDAEFFTRFSGELDALLSIL